MPEVEDVELWAKGLYIVGTRIGGGFERSKPREQAVRYIVMIGSRLALLRFGDPKGKRGITGTLSGNTTKVKKTRFGRMEAQSQRGE